MSDLIARDVMVVALIASPLKLDVAAANRAADYIETAFALQKLQVVAAGDGALQPGAGAGGLAGGAGAGTQTTVPRVPPKPRPEVFPKTCSRCHKIKNDRAHVEECEDGNCPL